MSLRSDREWAETVSGTAPHCDWCPYRACKDCPHAGGHDEGALF